MNTKLLLEDTERYIKSLENKTGSREEALIQLVESHRLAERLKATENLPDGDGE